jgi:hypothetical protein
METKGRRTLRASGPNPAPPLELPKPMEIPAEAEGEVASSTQAVPATPDPETTVDLPSVDKLTKERKSASPDDFTQFGRGVLAAVTQSQAALARGLEALTAEMAGLALSGIDTAARAAIKMLSVKTLSDAIDVNAGFASSSLGAFVSGSAKISELGVRVAAETSKPFLTQFGKGWGKARRPGA